MGKSRLGWYLLAILIVAAIALFSSCNPGKQNQNARPNVIFLLVDTLRADAVSAYGGKHPTPNIDGLARTGIMFTRAYAPSSWTVPSCASMVLGMYPQKHGLTEGMVFSRKIVEQLRLPEQYETLAESFQKAGYTTFGITTNAHMDEQYGFGDGFDHYKSIWFQAAPVLERKLKKWKFKLRRASKKTGYFLFVHWIDPHFPYSPKKPFIDTLQPGYLKNTPRTHDVFTKSELTKMGYRKGLAETGRLLEDVGPELLHAKGYFKKHPEALKELENLYASEVMFTDRSVGRVLKMLPGVDNSLIVFVSDHGEAFNEHNSMIHGSDLYQETVHVPLIMVYPENQGAGRKVQRPVSLVDIAPTLLSFAGITPPQEYQGRDLSPILKGEKLPSRLLWAQLDKADAFIWHAAFYRGMKLIAHLPSEVDRVIAKSKKKEAPTKQYALYNLLTDPGETKDLSTELSEPFAKLKAELDTEMSKPPLIKPETKKSEMSEKLKETMRDVGYL